MKKPTCLFALFLFAQTVVAQNNHLSGKVTTLELGSRLPWQAYIIRIIHLSEP